MKKRKVLLVVPIMLSLLVLYTAVSILLSRYALVLSKYELECAGISQPVRIVQLSDLHGSEFGDGNSTLIAKVKAQAPDLIVLTGDLVTQTEYGHEIAVHLISELSKTAPVYVSLGNHEQGYQAGFGVDIAQVYSDAGAVVLEKAYLDLEVGGQPIRLGGILGYCLAEQYLRSGEAKQDEIDFLKDFQDTDRYTILLAHNPAGWLVNTNLNDWQIDCVFSGHAHGGQVIIPFAGGVYGPDLGWFPGKLEGLFYSEGGGKALVLSRGLGSSTGVPRIHNIPEIVVVDLIPPP